MSPPRYSIAFYPFRAFFSLYYHILLSNDPKDYKDDILRLERLVAVITKASTVRFEFIPIAKAVLSLNNVAKQIQIAKTSQSPSKQWNTFDLSSLQTPRSDNTGSQNETGDVSARRASDGMAAQTVLFDDGLDIMNRNPFGAHWLPDFGDFRLTSTDDLQQLVNMPNFQPVEYMQAVEHQFQGASWDAGMWDNNGMAMFWDGPA